MSQPAASAPADPPVVRFNINPIRNETGGTLDIYGAPIYVNTAQAYPAVLTLNPNTRKLTTDQIGAVHIQGARRYYNATASATFPLGNDVIVTPAVAPLEGYIVTDAVTNETASFTAPGEWQNRWREGSAVAAVDPTAPEAPADDVNIDGDQEDDGKGEEYGAKPKY